MWMILLILLISLVIVAIEAPFLKRNGLKKEHFVFGCLLLLGTGLCIAEAVEANIPNPLDWITFVYWPFSDLILSMVE